MAELYWALEVLAGIQDDQSRIERNQELILERLEELKSQLEELGKKVDEQILVDFRTGMQHLLAGFNSEVDEVRTEEFRMARGLFTKLINLDPKGKTAGTSGAIENPYLICMGYWGSFQYFNLRGDHRNAMIHAYECTQQYPAIAAFEMNLFPAQLFSQDYAALWIETYRQLAELKALYDRNKSKNSVEKLAFYTKQALRTSAAGIAGLATGGVAAVIAGLFTGGLGAAPGSYIGYKTAESVWKSMPVAPPNVTDVESLESEIERLTTVLLNLPLDLTKECETRKTQLQHTTLKQLKSIDYRGKK